MPKKPTPRSHRSTVPMYRRQRRPTGDTAFVAIGGRRIHLGRYGSKASREKYHRVLAEAEANGGHLPIDGEEITITELTARYLLFADEYYRRPDGKPTSGVERAKAASRALNRLYGGLPAARFGPMALRAVRQGWIDAGLARPTVNSYTAGIKAIFKWAVSYELVRPEVHQALSSVAGLRRGRTEAVEPDPVRPVPQAHIDAIRPHVSRQIWGLVQLQLHTGARAGEIVTLRAIDIDTSGKVWTAVLGDHKTSHHDRERILYFGPRAQAVLRGFMAGRPVDAHLFSPREARAERAAIDARSSRRAGQPPTPTRTARKVGGHYTTSSYRRAIDRACTLAGVPSWSPHRLRHSAASRFRREQGLEAAQVLLGHARADVTQLYAEANRAKAVAAARRVG